MQLGVESSAMKGVTRAKIPQGLERKPQEDLLFQMQMTSQISVRSAEKGPSHLQGGNISSQGRSQEERLVEADDSFEAEGRELFRVSSISWSHMSPTDCHVTCPLTLHLCPSQLTCFLLPSALPLPLLTPILCSITCTRCSKDGASSVSPRSRGRLWGQRYPSGKRGCCPWFSRALTPCHQASPCQVWYPMSSLPPRQVAVSLSRPCFP